MTLLRERLVERIERIQPRLVLINAPAGFGKTTLAQQLGRLAGNAPALAQGPGRLVVDRADALGADELRDLSVQLTAQPEERQIVVCSRRPIGLATSKIAPPHRILTLRAGDLAFDAGDIAQLFAPHDVAKPALERIAELTRGWPIAVLLLRRLADEGRLADALSDPADAAFDEVHGYLAHEVFEALGEPELTGLLCSASLARATQDDLAGALPGGDAELSLERLQGLAPFLERGPGGALEVHPFVRATARRRYARRGRALAVEVAKSHERAERFLRAAQIYRDLGDLEATARAVYADNARPNRRQSAAFTDLVASLDQDTLARHRVLKGLTTYPRRFRVDPHRLRDEAESVWRTLPADTPFETRCNVAGPLTRIMYETGRFDEAESILRELEAEAGGIPEIPRSSGEAYIARTLACVLARSGRISEADAYFRKGYFALPGSEMVQSRYAIERALIERLFGRRDDERRFAEEAVELAVAQNAGVHIACALAEAAFGAWFAGDEAHFASTVERLTTRVQGDGMRGFAHFCAAARGIEGEEPNGTEQPNWLACAYLVACTASDGDRMVQNAERAKAAADESNDVFLQVVANVTLALTDPSRRNDLLLEALMLAGTIEVPGPQVAVAALLGGDGNCGMFAPLVARLALARRANGDPVLIELLTRSVRRVGKTLELRDRELMLLVALSRRRRACSRSEIVSLIWPDLDEAGARDALNTCLYRLRQRLGDEIVMWSRDGSYRLKDGVRVDLHEIDRWVGGLRADRTLQRHERTMLRLYYERLRDCRLEVDEPAEWLEPVLGQIRDTRHSAAERLAREALARAEFAEVFQIARELETDDPCDETACELAVRAHVAANDRPAAARRYRHFREVLRRELDVEPSPELARALNVA